MLYLIKHIIYCVIQNNFFIKKNGAARIKFVLKTPELTDFMNYGKRKRKEKTVGKTYLRKNKQAFRFSFNLQLFFVLFVQKKILFCSNRLDSIIQHLKF